MFVRHHTKHNKQTNLLIVKTSASITLATFLAIFVVSKSLVFLWIALSTSNTARRIDFSMRTKLDILYERWKGFMMKE